MNVNKTKHQAGLATDKNEIKQASKLDGNEIANVSSSFEYFFKVHGPMDSILRQLCDLVVRALGYSLMKNFTNLTCSTQS